MANFMCTYTYIFTIIFLSGGKIGKYFRQIKSILLLFILLIKVYIILFIIAYIFICKYALLYNNIIIYNSIYYILYFYLKKEKGSMEHVNILRLAHKEKPMRKVDRNTQR